MSFNLQGAMPCVKIIYLSQLYLNPAF